MNRFERQELLKGFGKTSQQKLRNSRILVIGAGGLGCPALLYLAAAGIGSIGIIDGDIVSLSNLNRQVLYGTGDVGKPKAETAGRFITERYPDVEVNVYSQFISTENALTIIRQYDLVLDGSDNFPTRYLVNDACWLLQKPLILGAIYQNEGQVAVFDPGTGIQYRDLYPIPPSANEVPNCNTTGVLGVLPGIIGTIQAAEAIKFITGFGNCLINKLLIYNLINHQQYELEVTSHPDAKKYGPQSIDVFMKTDYALSCGAVFEIAWEEAIELLNNEPSTLLLDLREENELPRLSGIPHQILPLPLLKERWPELLHQTTLILFCQSGVRSLKAASTLQQLLPGKNIYSIKGGIMQRDSPIYSN
jgi:sulfur-carrier protein adenylyltransferase/sulfurtransferase